MTLDYSEVIYCSRIGIRCPSVVRRKTALYDVGVQHHDLSMFRMMSDMDDTPRMRRKNPVPWPALRGVWPREGRSEVMRRYPSGAGNQRKPAGVPFVRMRELAGRRAQSITGPAGGCNFGATTAPDRSPAGSEMGIDWLGYCLRDQSHPVSAFLVLSRRRGLRTCGSSATLPPRGLKPRKSEVRASDRTTAYSLTERHSG